MKIGSLRIAVLAAALAIAPLGRAVEVQAGEVRVAVAANFTGPMNKLAGKFEQASGHKVVAVFGSTGNLYAQIENGAPYEVLLSADEERPALLEKEGLVVSGSRFTYAVGQLALWSAKPGLVDANGEVLRGDNFVKLAVANPKTAPYGGAAMEAIESLGLADHLKDRIVQATDIGQTFQYVATGSADLGFVALSQLMASDSARGTPYWLVPRKLYRPLRQQAVLLNNGANLAAAKALIAYLKSEEARTLIRASGYAIE
jgi:molybdate transport system substrate-binding protein